MFNSKYFYVIFSFKIVSYVVLRASALNVKLHFFLQNEVKVSMK